MLSKDSTNWQKDISSVVSGFNDNDDGAIEELLYLFSNRNVTLQMAFSISGKFFLNFRCPLNFFFSIYFEALNVDEEVSSEQTEIESLKKCEAF